jgi:hypothetical protein
MGEQCEISSSHGGEYDVQSCLLGYTAVKNYCPPTSIIPHKTTLNMGEQYKSFEAEACLNRFF